MELKMAADLSTNHLYKQNNKNENRSRKPPKLLKHSSSNSLSTPKFLSPSSLLRLVHDDSARSWVPLHRDLPLAPTANISLPSTPLHFIIMDPKLHVNTTKVNVENRPVTGMRLYLQGMKCDRVRSSANNSKDRKIPFKLPLRWRNTKWKLSEIDPVNLKVRDGRAIQKASTEMPVSLNDMELNLSRMAILAVATSPDPSIQSILSLMVQARGASPLSSSK